MGEPRDRDPAPSEDLELELQVLGPHDEPDESSRRRGGVVAESAAILVVDDDDDMRRYIRACLERDPGWVGAIAEAGDGATALDVVDASMDTLELVITDVVMPGMGGLDLVREIRRRRPSPPPAVLLVTGEYTGREAKRQALEVGAQAALVKPFNARKLCRAVLALRQPRGPPTG